MPNQVRPEVLQSPEGWIYELGGSNMACPETEGDRGVFDYKAQHKAGCTGQNSEAANFPRISGVW